MEKFKIMKSSILLIVFFINSYCRAYSLQDYSDFTEEDFKGDLFLYEPETDNVTVEVEDVTVQGGEGIEITTVNFTKVQITSSEKKDPRSNFTDDTNLETGKNVPLKEDVSNQEENLVSITLTETPGARTYLGELSREHLQNNEQQDQFFEGAEINSIQALRRREVGSGAVTFDSEESLDALEAFPLNDEFFYASEMQQPQIDYLDYSNLQEGQDVKEVNSTVNKSRIFTEASGQQYLQKNYYYNYYPVVRKNGKTQKWPVDGKSILGEQNRRQKRPGHRKYGVKNSCKQYLEFLKFAFEKLDESPEYDYEEPDNDYFYEYEMQNEYERPLFKTQLFGPSVYIDNSGKIFQLDPEKRIYQTFKSPFIDPKMFHKFHQPFTPLMHPTDKTHVTSHLPNESSAASKTIFPNTNQDFQMRNRMTANPFSPSTRHSGNLDFTQKDRGEFKSRTTTQTTNFFRFDDKGGSTNYKFDVTPTLQITEFATERRPPSFQTTQYMPKTELPSTNVDLWSKFSAVTTSSPFTPMILNPSTSEQNDYHTSDQDVKDTNVEKKEEPDCNDKMLPCPVTYNITYPLNGYCNRFVSCESGKAIRRTCPEGLHFNLITKSCDLPHNSICAYACPKADGYYGIPGDCGGYFKCKNSVAEYRMCPPKMHWNSKTEICTFDELSSCPMKCSKKNEIKRYDGNCQAYIICLQGVAYYHKCPANTNFDPKVMTCIPEHLSKCQNNPKLMTKYLNPNQLCKDVNMKMIPGMPCDMPKKRKEKEIMLH